MLSFERLDEENKSDILPKIDHAVVLQFAKSRMPLINGDEAALREVFNRPQVSFTTKACMAPGYTWIQNHDIILSISTNHGYQSLDRDGLFSERAIEKPDGNFRGGVLFCFHRCSPHKSRAEIGL